MWLVCVMRISRVIGLFRVIFGGSKFQFFFNCHVIYNLTRLGEYLKICMILVCGMLTSGVIGSFKVILWGNLTRFFTLKVRIEIFAHGYFIKCVKFKNLSEYVFVLCVQCLLYIVVFYDIVKL
jgi:hypothetical protein